MYVNEMTFMDNAKFSKYTIKTEPCQDQVYFFYGGKQTKFRPDSKNQFENKQLDILKRCGVPINVNKCPPKKQ